MIGCEMGMATPVEGTDAYVNRAGAVPVTGPLGSSSKRRTGVVVAKEEFPLAIVAAIAPLSTIALPPPVASDRMRIGRSVPEDSAPVFAWWRGVGDDTDSTAAK